jgi:hypothetical protein
MYSFEQTKNNNHQLSKMPEKAQHKGVVGGVKKPNNTLVNPFVL